MTRNEQERGEEAERLLRVACREVRVPAALREEVEQRARLRLERAPRPVAYRFVVQAVKWSLSNALRSERRRKDAEAAYQEGLTARKASASTRLGLRDVVERLLETLDKGDRELLRGIYLEGRSAKELAQRMGLKEAAIRKRLFRARRRAAEVLKKIGFSPFDLP
jgi:RNA polymerase sigma factor (sigma-70 family)